MGPSRRAWAAVTVPAVFWHVGEAEGGSGTPESSPRMTWGWSGLPQRRYHGYLPPRFWGWSGPPLRPRSHQRMPRAPSSSSSLRDLREMREGKTVGERGRNEGERRGVRERERGDTEREKEHNQRPAQRFQKQPLEVNCLPTDRERKLIDCIVFGSSCELGRGGGAWVSSGSHWSVGSGSVRAVQSRCRTAPQEKSPTPIRHPTQRDMEEKKNTEKEHKKRESLVSEGVKHGHRHSCLMTSSERDGQRGDSTS